MSVAIEFAERTTDAPRIFVVGVGGSGGNVLNTLIGWGCEGVQFVAVNTDAHALSANMAPNKVQIGGVATRGLGAGADLEKGGRAALEDIPRLKDAIAGADMVFVTTGLGGGTGTGAAPVIAQLAREAGCLTVGVVTKPFFFEGKQRARRAELGLAMLAEQVDTLITIPNQKLLLLGDEELSFVEAFRKADESLSKVIFGILGISHQNSIVNIDFEDLRSVLGAAGRGLAGIGIARGPDRARKAAELATTSPLLDDVAIAGATKIIINIVGGPDMRMREIEVAATVIQEQAHEDASIIFGATIDDKHHDAIEVTVIATGLDSFSVDLLPSDVELSAAALSVGPVMGSAPPGANEATGAIQRVAYAAQILKLGRMGEARRILEACLPIFQAFNLVDAEASTLSYLSATWDAAGDLEVAISLEERALRAANQLPDVGPRVRSHLNLARLHGRQQRMDLALLHLVSTLIYNLDNESGLETAIGTVRANVHAAQVRGEKITLPRLGDLLERRDQRAVGDYVKAKSISLPNLQASIDIIMLHSLQAGELAIKAEKRDFTSVADLQGEWLPGVEGATEVLLGFRDAARYLAAAAATRLPFYRLEHLTQASRTLEETETRMRVNRSVRLTFEHALTTWRNITTSLRSTAERAARDQVPNPFRVGEPLTPELGAGLFRGRMDVVDRIGALLAGADQRASIALIGPRRCGKTSLLRMLPTMLPDAVCVFFDLQDNPASTSESFVTALVQQTREQARRDRRLELPHLPAGHPFEALAMWLKVLDEHLSRRILICFDEFERLEDLFPGGKREFLQFMGLLRATIQHRRNVRLLVSGAAPFDELGHVWRDHFINTRHIPIGHLEKGAATELLIRPIEGFPSQAIPLEVANRIFERTGGQPFLLQAYASELIALLNDQHRPCARVDDISVIEEKVLVDWAYYFEDLVAHVPSEARPILSALARGDRPSISAKYRSWLNQRYIIDDRMNLVVPALGRWVELNDENSQ